MPAGGRCATLAAQVKHVALDPDVLEQVVRTQQFARQDWGKIAPDQRRHARRMGGAQVDVAPEL